MLETGFIKRCGICMFKFERDAVKMEDGIEKCVNCTDHRDEAWKAATEAREVAYAASREPQPQMSQAALERAFPSTIRYLSDTNGSRVSQSAPLNLSRGVAKTLLLNGREFASSDAITGSTGLIITVSARTSTQTTLSVTAVLSMTPGNYSLRFNDSDWLNIFSVR